MKADHLGRRIGNNFQIVLTPADRAFTERVALWLQIVEMFSFYAHLALFDSICRVENVLKLATATLSLVETYGLIH